MPYYTPNLVSKTTHVGNSLSSFNLSFSALDTNLYNLSAYTVDSISNIEDDIDTLSSLVIPTLYTLTSAPSSSATFNLANGFLQSLTLTSNMVIMEPQGTPYVGQQLKIYLNSGVGGYNFTFHPNILIPSESTFSSPYTLLSAKQLWITQLEYLSSDWALTTLVGGYSI